MDNELEEELNVGVSEYLKEWGLSKSTISNFEENEISFKLIDSIQETELKELIPSLKERILFKRGLNKLLQNIIHATESDETLSIDSDFSVASSTSSNELPLSTTKENSSNQSEVIMQLDYRSTAHAASGGNNDARATVKDLAFHVSNTNIILLIILLILSLIVIYGLYRAYLRCHKQMIRREINGQVTFRRSFGMGKRTAPPEEV